MLPRALRRRYQTLRFLRQRSEPVSIGLRNQWKMWRNGFFSQSYLVYRLDKNDPADYVTDDVQFRLAMLINGYYAVALYDKLYQTLLLGCFPECVPPTHGLLRDGRLSFLGRSDSLPVAGLPDFLCCRRRLVLRPLTGNQGEGFYFLEQRDGAILLNSREITEPELLRRAASWQDYLVTDFIDQHPYSARIFPGSTNTVRILTLWDDETQEPFVAAAVHRFGTEAIAPIDSWSRGGVAAGIHIETGRLRQATPKPLREKPSFRSCHPDTGERIEGVIIPHWETVKHEVLRMAAALHFIPYIGWDIVVTEKGLQVIEANNGPGLILFQVHEPLLLRPRVRRFFEKHVERLSGPRAEKRQYKLPFKV